LPYEQQPFYEIKKERIFINPETDKPIILVPGTPLDSGKKIENGENYWNNGDDFYVKLGKDQYWMMGDNRLGSLDSRFFGPIDERLIHGKILFRIWSVDSDENWWILDLIKHPIDFIKRIRFNRFFQVVK
jgi:signal peptidase I